MNGFQHEKKFEFISWGKMGLLKKDEQTFALFQNLKIN